MMHYVFPCINPSQVLVGNKIDLNSLRAVSYFDGARFAKEHRIAQKAAGGGGGGKEMFVETSALDRCTVDNAFTTLFKAVVASQRNAPRGGGRGGGGGGGGEGDGGGGGDRTSGVQQLGGGGGGAAGGGQKRSCC